MHEDQFYQPPVFHGDLDGLRKNINNLEELLADVIVDLYESNSITKTRAKGHLKRLPFSIELIERSLKGR